MAIESKLGYKALIIDFDDTLSLTEEGCFLLENEVLRELGRSEMSRQVHKDTWGMKLGDAMLVRSPGINVEDFWQLQPEVHQRFVREGKVDNVPAENLRVIDELRSSGLMTFILTSRTGAEMTHLLDPAHELATRLDGFYYHDNMHFHKPDPRAFAQIETEHGLKPEECVYIGDNASDAAASTGAGLGFIACLEAGIRTKEDFNGYPVLAYVDRFADVAKVLTTTK